MPRTTTFPPGGAHGCGGGAWLVRWLKDPEGMVKTDPVGKETLAKCMVPMPNQNLSEEEIREYAYFRWADENLRFVGTTQPQPAAPGDRAQLVADALDHIDAAGK